MCHSSPTTCASALGEGGVSLLASSVLVYGSLCLVGCVILRRQMLHLLSGDLYTRACAWGGVS